jgi:Relaxase/Mobilisation nuclease domain
MRTPGRNEPLFDPVSFARRGPGRRDRLAAADLQQIAHTVRRAPEVMVKVLPRGANDLGAVRRHADYIGRKGDLDIETDQGETLRERGVGATIIEDWDLELDAHRGRSELTALSRSPRLVHKLMFSMPPGAPPEKVLNAVRNFLREEFALKHRYALVLHTDEPHPHVHVLLKAVSEDGKRLHIKKPTLQEWRTGFAAHLRALGVAANATSRFVRGETLSRKSDPIYRAGLRGESTHLRDRAQAVASELATGRLRPEHAKAQLASSRDTVQRAWLSIGNVLLTQGEPDLASHVLRFAEQLPLPMTERERIAAELIVQGRQPANRTPKDPEKAR